LLQLDLKESNVSLKLTIVETVGYGDQINKEDRLATLVGLIFTRLNFAG